MLKVVNGTPANGPNPSTNGGPHPSTAMNGSMDAQSRLGTMSRAERFEDEKRRIIESCFSKLDPNGQLAESYITHIRVQEDSTYPSSPPPPDSNPENKKPRLIIIAVRSTGRVRMHKARENNNGSFSIGKTWNLEELAAIESFSNSTAPPQSEQEAQYRSWAGNIGFTVTITKPYYWQAGTAKEKEFFIASAVKIYRKYTKGQVPELRGFDEHQKASMLGALPGQPSPPPQAPPPLGARGREASPSPASGPPQPPFAQDGSRERSRYRDSPGPPPSMSELAGGAVGSRNQSPVPKPFASSEHLRSYSPVSFQREPRPSTASGASGASGLRSPPPIPPAMPLSQQSSHSQLRSESPANGSIASGREGSGNLPPFAPQRKASGHSTDGVSERQMPLSPPPNGAFGQQYNQNQQSRSQSPAVPPIQTLPLLGKVSNNQAQSPASATPQTGQSSLSSPGIGDPSAFASLSGYMGPSQSVAGTTAYKSPTDSSNPPTPVRSQRRPTLEGTMSDTNVETLKSLKPAPLNTQSSRGAATPDGTSAYATPREGVSPSSEPPPQIAHGKHNSDSNLPISGSLQRSNLAPSPLSTPAQTPGNEPSEDAAKEVEEEFRPGLGPMIKKKAVADRLKKAAMAANSFKPRPGGAAEKILKAKAEREANGEPDGITGVVPRPFGRQASKNDDPTSKQANNLAVKNPTSPPPQIDVTNAGGLDGMDGSRGVELNDDAPSEQNMQEEKSREQRLEELMEQRKLRQPVVKVKRRSATHERYLDHLGIDRSLLADRCLDFEVMLHDFGWNNAALSPKALTEMDADIRREQSRLDAGGWLSAPSHETNLRQERENQVMRLLDKAIQECDEMDGLLTIYNVELSSLNEDIAYIEAQSQGLQVHAANQRNLHTELTSLVQTLSLDKKTLDGVRSGDLSSPRGVDEVEQSLKKLYQAIIAIDPNIRSNPSGRPSSRNDASDGSELRSMAAVKQKQESYLHQSELFCQRFVQHLDYMFTTSFNNAKAQALVPASGASGGVRLQQEAYINARKNLWVYSPLILFTKELNLAAWHGAIKTYSVRARPLYADAFGQNVASWKRAVRKPTGEEGEILFTAQEKDETSSGGIMSSSARKLTVKRSQNLAKTLRKASDERPGSAESRGGMHFCEVFSGAMGEMAPLISQEQNFIVDLFHMTSLETADFVDTITTLPPDQRHGTNLVERKPMDPDREMARQVTTVMEEVFGFFTNELSKLLEWSVSVDPIQGIGVMASLNRHAYYLQDGNQEFLIQLTDTLMARLQNLFAKFVDEQIRAIEDTKVRIKKRKGVIGFMRIFPHFAAAVENAFALVGQADYDHDAACMAEVRKRIDEAYTRINKAMFDSLKAIAKEGGPAMPMAVAAARAATDDPEGKEKLNYDVLIIENMNHYIEEVDDGGRRSVLVDWKGRAQKERAEALESYVGQVIRRPLGKLLDFLFSIESVIAAHPNNPAGVTSRPSFSRKSARSVLSQYDAKEIRRGIDHLRTRIEKHFGVGDDEAICRALVALVCKECEKAYETTILRVEGIIRELYPSAEGEKPVELEFSRADVQAGFRK